VDSKPKIYDPVSADGRFQLQLLGLRWALIALYALFTYLGYIAVQRPWFIASEGYLVGFHIYYAWYVVRDLGSHPLPPRASYATPFFDTIAVSLALVAIGDPLHPIWAVYFFIVVGVAFFYYSVARHYLVWLMLNYAMVGVGLQLRGAEFHASQMVVAGTILLAGMLNLIAYTESERRLRGRISNVARRDPLTNLLNRRGLEETLQAQIDSPAREAQPAAVFMADIDRFKRYNDQFGHLAADGILEQLGQVLLAAVREPELVARYGGDEFVVVVPGVTPEEALSLAERLRAQMARLGLCTLSIGVAVARPGESATVLLTRADAALLEAKQSGRNCVRSNGIRSAAEAA
jgi:diguanylate cyclase (GGDEF)-like protein